MVLIRQAKEAEDKRNQEMRKFADGRERHAKQQTQVVIELPVEMRGTTPPPPAVPCI